MILKDILKLYNFRDCFESAEGEYVYDTKDIRIYLTPKKWFDIGISDWDDKVPAIEIIEKIIQPDILIMVVNKIEFNSIVNMIEIYLEGESEAD